MMNPRKRKVMPMAEWPTNDRQCWERALLGGDNGEGAATEWSPSTCRKNELAYGRLLQALDDVGQLDPDGNPIDRLTRPIIAWITEMMEGSGMAPYSIAAILSSLCDTARVMVPDQEWSWLRARARAAARNAKSVRNPAAGRVDPGEIFRLGLHIMNEVASLAWRGAGHLSARFGEGLAIAMLTSVPALRSRALRELRPSDLALCDHYYQLTIRLGTTKTRERTETYPLPALLTPYIQRYLESHRPALLEGRQQCDALILSGKGRAYSGSYLWARTVAHTLPAFKLLVGPHRVRHCSATAIATRTPERIIDTKVILGHASLATSQRYYNLAHGLEATRRFQGAMLKVLAEAK